MISKSEPQYDETGKVEYHMFSGNLPGMMRHQVSHFLSTLNSDDGTTYTFMSGEKLIRIGDYNGKTYLDWRKVL